MIEINLYIFIRSGKMKKEKKLTNKWLFYCINIRIPLGLIFGIYTIITLLVEKIIWSPIVIVYCIVYVLIYILDIMILILYYKKRNFFCYKIILSTFFLESILYAYNSYLRNFYTLSTTLIILFIFMLLWFFPNYLYLRKRKQLFINVDSVDEKLFYCKKCGGKVINKKCLNCGKQYINFKIVSLFLIFSVSIFLNIYQLIKIENLQEEKNILLNTNDLLEENYSELVIDYNYLNYVNNANTTKLNFFDSYAVIVPEGSSYYYSYDCYKTLSSTTSFYIYNVSNAIAQGFKSAGC